MIDHQRQLALADRIIDIYALICVTERRAENHAIAVVTMNLKTGTSGLMMWAKMTTYTVDARSEIERLSARVTQLEEIIANLATSMMTASMLNPYADLWSGALRWADDAGEKLMPDEPV